MHNVALIDRNPTQLSWLQKKQLSNLTSTREHWFFYHMPYLYEPLHHPNFRNVYLPLNRLYKPLGVLHKNHVDYTDYMQTHAIHFRSDPRTFRNIWHNVGDDGGLYLYSDELDSRVGYFDRLELLFQRPMKVMGKRQVDFDCVLHTTDDTPKCSPSSINSAHRPHMLNGF